MFARSRTRNETLRPKSRQGSHTIMHPLSEDARLILDRMEPDRSYEAAALRALVPGASAERLQELMHELWVSRQVERSGYSGWQRHRSAPAHQRPVEFQETKVVKPEDLFDHGSFRDFFSLKILPAVHQRARSTRA